MTTDGQASEKPAGLTPSQTVGPFFAYMLTPHAYGTREVFTTDMATPDAAGQRIRIEGKVLDGVGNAIPDAVVELWQADGEGRYRTANDGLNAAFTGFGRSDVDQAGAFGFATVKPGRVPGPGGKAQAPHINVGLFARGVTRRLFTRLYFADEAANAEDPILALVPEDRRGTLIAEKAGDNLYRITIRLQGEGETVFFEN